MNFYLIIPVILTTLLNAIANATWKVYFHKVPFSCNSFYSILELFNIYILFGIFCYGISMMSFFYLLSRYELSFLVPLTALTYVFNMLAAYFIFHESFDVYKISGIVVIIAGIMILSLSK